MAFDKLKQLGELNKLRKQAKELQKELEQITEKVEERGIEVKVTGDQKIVYLKIEDQERNDIAEAINKAMKNVQKKAARKMMEMGGGLSGHLHHLSGCFFLNIFHSFINRFSYIISLLVFNFQINNLLISRNFYFNTPLFYFLSNLLKLLLQLFCLFS